MGAGERTESEYQRERDLDALLAPAGYHCIHRCTPSASSQFSLDHVLIGPAGIFVVQDLNLTDELRQGLDGRVWSGGQPLDGQMDEALARAAAVSRSLGTHASALLAVHGAEVRTPPVVRGVNLLAASEVPALVLRRSPYCSPGAVATLAARARIALAAERWTVPAALAPKGRG